MSKINKVQISKIIQSNVSFRSRLRNLDKKSVRNAAILFTIDSFSVFVINIYLNTINKFEKGISEKGAVRPQKVFTLFISNENMDDNILTVKLREDSGVLINVFAIKHKTKNQES